MTNKIRIYVADLAAYNNGFLHGAWIDATLDPADIQSQINAMIADSPVDDAEEYAIHDYDGFGGCAVSEYAGLRSVHDLAVFIEQFPKLGAGLRNHFGNLDDARKAAADNYCGVYAALADYAQELTEETTDIPQALAYYIDYEKMARDLELNGDVFTIETGFQEVHVFWNR